MKLHLDGARDTNRIHAYGAGHVNINGTRYTSSLIVTAGQIRDDWPPERFEDITAEHLARLADRDTEIVLLGTGTRQRFPEPDLLAPLVARGLHLEVMMTSAACRTFNILVSENRLVAAALLMMES